MLNEYDPKSGTLRGAGEKVGVDSKNLAQARKEGKEAVAPRTPPVYWAAFVLSGDWR